MFSVFVPHWFNGKNPEDLSINSVYQGKSLNFIESDFSDLIRKGYTNSISSSWCEDQQWVKSLSKMYRYNTRIIFLKPLFL